MIFIEIMLLAFTIFSEALHEGVYGKYAVASAIHNRVIDPKFPHTYSEVVLQKRKNTDKMQFSCYDNYNTIVQNIGKIENRKLEWITSIIIATAFVSGDAKPIVKSKHYTQKGNKKIWMKNMEIETIIENHQYLLEK